VPPLSAGVIVCRVSDANGTAPLTRGRVAALLGVSTSSVRRMEGRHLHPTTGPDGVRLFDAAEVEAVARTRARRGAREGGRLQAMPDGERRAGDADGETAARAFGLFADGRSPADVVIDLRLPPARAAELHEQWRRLSAPHAVLAPEDRARLEARTGRRITSDTIAPLLGELLDRLDTLPTYCCPGCDQDVQVSSELLEWLLGRLQYVLRAYVSLCADCAPSEIPPEVIHAFWRQ